jgi:hypothetical protein
VDRLDHGQLNDQVRSLVTLAHEGDHGVQGSSFFPSYQDNFENEKHAYTTGAFMNQYLGVDSTFGIWTRQDGWNESAIQKAAKASADHDGW